MGSFIFKKIEKHRIKIFRQLCLAACLEMTLIYFLGVQKLVLLIPD